MLIFRIFGAGEWGLAVANHLSLNNNVEVYLRDKEKIELYKKNNQNYIEIFLSRKEYRQILYIFW